MKTFVAILLVIKFCLALPVQKDEAVSVVSYVNEPPAAEDGAYRFEWVITQLN